MSRHHATRSDDGFTLVELIVTTGIMGIAFLIILGGLFTSVAGSILHRHQATAETAIRSFAEAVKTAAYDDDCTDVAVSYSAAYEPPSGYAAEITAIRYWDGKSLNDTGFIEECPPAGKNGEPKDLGLQRISLQISSDDGRATEVLEIIKRRPTSPPAP